jgi:hypothetical protein
MSIYPAPTTGAPATAAMGQVAARSGVSAVFGRLTPDLRRDTREALRALALAGEARSIFMERLKPAGVRDDSKPDPYDDSPDPKVRTYSVVNVGGAEVVLLQIPDWIANDGSTISALNEARYMFSRKRKVIRFLSEGVDAPSMGLRRLMRDWRTQDDIDAAFVEWRYVREMSEGRHKLVEVLEIDADASDGVAPPFAAPAAALQGPRVFVSYAHKDREWYLKLMQQLAQLRRKYGEDAFWSDPNIPPGSNWNAEIARALESAPIVVLLVSPAFIASEFIQRNEYGLALQEAEVGRKKLLWVYVSTGAVKDFGIAAYQAAHDIAQPLDLLSEGQQAVQLQRVYDSVAAELEKLVRV